jgi:hypothetical protein
MAHNTDNESINLSNEEFKLLVMMAKESRFFQGYHGFMFLTKSLNEQRIIMQLIARNGALVWSSVMAWPCALIMASYGEGDAYDIDLSDILDREITIEL